jgi:hypothetical protein
MKRILFVLVMLVPFAPRAPGTATAQETYCTAANASQQARVERDRLRRNRSTCLRLGAVGGATCTQAAACVAAAAVGGASCTVAAARAVNAEIFANTQAGRELVFNSRVVPLLKDIADQNSLEDRSAQCIWWNDPATTQAERNAACNLVKDPATGLPLGNGCELCPP